MTRAEVQNLMASFGLPTALNHFPADRIETIAPPFIVFDYPESDDFVADNSNYLKVDALSVDLYTETMDFELMDRIGDALSAAGFVYDVTRTWITSEKMYQISYTTEVING